MTIPITLKLENLSQSVEGVEVKLTTLNSIYWEESNNNIFSGMTNSSGMLEAHLNAQRFLMPQSIMNVTITADVTFGGQNYSSSIIFELKQDYLSAILHVDSSTSVIDVGESIEIGVVATFNDLPLTNVTVSANATTGYFSNGLYTINMTLDEYGQAAFYWTAPNISQLFDVMEVNITLSIVDDFFIAKNVVLVIYINPNAMEDDGMIFQSETSETTASGVSSDMRSPLVNMGALTSGMIFGIIAGFYLRKKLS